MEEGLTQTELWVFVAPGFNMAATTAFLDPFRAANYIAGAVRFRWTLVSPNGGPVEASNGLQLLTEALDPASPQPDYAVVSTSWAPERQGSEAVYSLLRRWQRFGARVVGVDTGGFLLAEAGLLSGRRATVHYEHLDAFGELYPNVQTEEDLYVVDGPCLTSAGGGAAGDLALWIVEAEAGTGLARASAQYTLSDGRRPEGRRQSADPEVETAPGTGAPATLRDAIRLMEQHLEDRITIPDICDALAVSQRQLQRLFKAHVGKSPQLYYRDIRLDRARGLVTQTDMPLSEIALACGFVSAVHFARVYRDRFGLPASRDRVEGRVPFEYRAWPMHRSTGTPPG